MDPREGKTLSDLRSRIDRGEEFNQTLLARYNDLVAQEARAAGMSVVMHVFSLT